MKGQCAAKQESQATRLGVDHQGRPREGGDDGVVIGMILSHRNLAASIMLLSRFNNAAPPRTQKIMLPDKIGAFMS
jgi:hypothetical protein